ncbi:MAG: hypothetical protein ACOX6N_04295 [Patescibacteria group bacterium]
MNKVLKIYARVFVFLFPLVLLPTAVDTFGFGKVWVLVAGGMIGLLLWVASMLVGKNNVVKTNKLFGLLTLLLIWAAIGWFRMPMGVRMRSLTEPTGMGVLAGLWMWVFLWLQVRDKEETSAQIKFLSAAGAVLALSSIAVFLIPNVRMPINIPKDNPIISIRQGWSLAGSVFAEALVLLFLAVEWVRRLTVRLKKKDNFIKEAVLAAVFTLVLMLDLYKIYQLGWVALDRSSTWVIAAETLKTNPIFGVGVGNFVRAFTLFRPASYNMTEYWSLVFADSSMGAFHLWTEMGIGGLLAVFWMVSSLLKKRKAGAAFGQGALFLAIALLLPMNMLGLFILAWIAAFKLSEVRESKLVLNVGEDNFNVMPLVVGVTTLALVVFSGYWWSKVGIADYFYRQSLVAASKNDGGQTYDLQIKAIGWNPYNDNYRMTYSQTNLALAQNLLSNEELTEDDKQKASVLIQQSVREAQAAISLDNLNSAYWANLAAIYKAIVGVVDGAADWSFQAYQQAAALDPVNPMLKLDLGGLLYAAERYQDAERIFEQVVTNKSDFANGWYNWAYTAKQQNKIGDAYQRLAQAVALVPADSGDFEKANEELAEWKKELEAAIKQQEEMMAQQAGGQEEKEPETLSTPDPLPTVGEEERVNVPAEELEPPEPIVTPEEAEPTPVPETPTQTPEEEVLQP